MNIASLALSSIVAFAAPAIPRAPGPGVETFEYTVVEGDTCAEIAGRFFGSNKRYDVIHRFNPGMGPQPHDLVPGTVLVLPRAGAVKSEGPDAEVTATRRKVEARAADEASWRAAAIGLDLFRGWRVNTLARAWAELTFRDTSVLEVRENTLVIIYGASEDTARRSTTEASLDRGALRSRLGELAGGAKLHVDTPSSSTDLAGGRALVTVDGGGTSRIANHGGGTAAVAARDPAPRPKAKKKPTIVASGMGSKVETGGSPTPPKALPPPPTFVADQATRFVGIASVGATIVARWTPEPKAAAYRVEIARKPDGRDVVADGFAPGNVTRLELYGLPPGDYWVSVASIDDDHFEGIPTTPLGVRVTEASLVALDGAKLVVPTLVDDAVAPAPPQIARGAALVAPSGMWCAAQGDEPSGAALTFASPGPTAVVCRDHDGASAAAFTVDVQPWTIAIDGDATEVPLVVGVPTTVVFSASSGTTTATALVAEAPAGVEVGTPRRQSDGRWALDVTATAAPTTADGTPPRITLSLPSGVTVGEIAIAVAPDDAEVPVRPRPQGRWIDRHAPVRNMWELGLFGGAFVAARGLELFEPDDARPDQGFLPLRRTNPTLGARLGYFPLRVLGVEVEAALTPSESTTGNRATIFAARGHVVGRLGFASITPFVLAGVGLVGVDSNPSVVGRDVDASLHFGGGLEVFATRRLAVRLDVRDIVTADRGLDAGLTSSLEVTGGLSITLGRKRAAAQPRGRRGGETIVDASAPLTPPDGRPARPPAPAVVVPVEPTPTAPAEPPPPVDADADGVLDDADRCRDAAETPNGFEDADGCPDTLPAALREFAGVMEGIAFETASDVITPKSRPTLDRAVAVLKEFPSVRVRIAGHTDDVGKREANVALSTRRAEAVRRYLVDAGIAADRLEIRGAGPDEPVDSNATKQGRARNRRIEFELIGR
jgi:outer membrane protein OmpA-like peptidoglycan-associated protein